MTEEEIKQAEQDVKRLEQEEAIRQKQKEYTEQYKDIFDYVPKAPTPYDLASDDTQPTDFEESDEGNDWTRYEWKNEANKRDNKNGPSVYSFRPDTEVTYPDGTKGYMINQKAYNIDGKKTGAPDGEPVETKASLSKSGVVSIYEQSFTNDNGDLNSPDPNTPSYFAIDQKTGLATVAFRKDGELHNENGPSRLVFNPATGRIVSVEHHIDGVHHNANSPSQLEFHDNGNLKLERHHLDGSLHNVTGPADVEFYENGQTKSHTHYQQGEEHNTNGPSHEKFTDKGVWLSRRHCTEGKLNDQNGKMALSVHDLKKGTAKHESYKDGVKNATTKQVKETKVEEVKIANPFQNIVNNYEIPTAKFVAEGTNEASSTSVDILQKLALKHWKTNDRFETEGGPSLYQVSTDAPILYPDGQENPFVAQYAYHKDNQLHNLEGPSNVTQSIDDDGNAIVRLQETRENGNLHSQNGEFSRYSLDPKTGLATLERHDNGRLHSTGPEDPSRIVFDPKTGQIKTVQFHNQGELSKKGGAADMEWDMDTGNLIKEDFYKGGDLHRMDGYALNRFDKDGNLIQTEVHANGIQTNLTDLKNAPDEDTYDIGRIAAQEALNSPGTPDMTRILELAKKRRPREDGANYFFDKNSGDMIETHKIGIGRDGKLHRAEDEGPAFKVMNEGKRYRVEQSYENNRLHALARPANIVKQGDTFLEEWYREGKLYLPTKEEAEAWKAKKEAQNGSPFYDELKEREIGTKDWKQEAKRQDQEEKPKTKSLKDDMVRASRKIDGFNRKTKQILQTASELVA